MEKIKFKNVRKMKEEWSKKGKSKIWYLKEKISKYKKKLKKNRKMI